MNDADGQGGEDQAASAPDDPAACDPRAYRAASLDGKPLAAWVGDDGRVRLMVGAEVARLDAGMAMKLLDEPAGHLALRTAHRQRFDVDRLGSLVLVHDGAGDLKVGLA